MKSKGVLPQYILALLLFLLNAASAVAQTQNVTFRYVPGGEQSIVRAYVPGEFNGWGPNNSGQIPVDAPSLMTFVDSLDQWIKVIPLQIGSTYQYKMHVHLNDAGTSWEWITDPLNPRINTADNNNSVVTITDPMVFQLGGEGSGQGVVETVTANLMSTSGIASIQFWANGIEQDGLPFFNDETGILRIALDRPVATNSLFKVKITDTMGVSDSLEVGQLIQPVSWAFSGFETVRDVVTLRASILREDGSIDSTLTSARLRVNDASFRDVTVNNSVVEVEENLQFGSNVYVLEAEVNGQAFATDSLVITKKRHPLDTFLFNATAGGSGFAFSVNTILIEGAPDDVTFEWSFDSLNSTTGLETLDVNASGLTGKAEGPGEIYFDVVARSDEREDDRQRIALVAEENSIVRSMQYAETPSWVNEAVVYEIFPLSFGPEASGTESAPGNRFKEITRELDYIAAMGFNVIWFMPVMDNLIMDQISGGYNIVDFYNVDPKLGTNDDFKALVNRAHELGIKIIMDITPNHVSPAHPWIDALKESGTLVPPGSFMQTVPSSHNRGQDGRGANLEEVWQLGDGVNLYRKYNGFGDLGNVDWDDDDLQAEFLEIFAHWIEEFGIDGWRFDVYWGPWRRYGVERFGQPIRELMKRIKPDSWLLGEIAGTGSSTEVYYTDDQNGSALVGGIDAGYDWNFYFDAVKGTYGNISNYDAKLRNGDFWPGPNARYFRFLENHDEERIAKIHRSAPERILPLTGMLLTTTGVPMIYQGQEVNFGNVSGDERRIPVSWNTALNGQFASYHQRLIHARRTFDALGTQDLETLSTSDNVYSFVRPYLDENAVVLINFSDEPRSVSVNPTPVVELTTDGPVVYTNIFADSSFVDAELDGFEIQIPAFETVILIANGGEDVRFDVPALPSLPFGAVFTGVEDNLERGYSFTLQQNYPNPSSGQTTIQYALPEAGHVRLLIYDILGREVSRVVDQYALQGTHTVTYDASHLVSGMYIYTLKTEEGSLSKTMTIIR